MTNEQITGTLRENHNRLKPQLQELIRLADELDRRQYQLELLTKFTENEVSLDRIQITMKEGETSFSLNVRDLPSLENDVRDLCRKYQQEMQTIFERSKVYGLNLITDSKRVELWKKSPLS
jgi:hypothetical protein